MTLVYTKDGRYVAIFESGTVVDLPIADMPHCELFDKIVWYQDGKIKMMSSPGHVVERVIYFEVAEMVQMSGYVFCICKTHFCRFRYNCGIGTMEYFKKPHPDQDFKIITKDAFMNDGKLYMIGKNQVVGTKKLETAHHFITWDPPDLQYKLAVNSNAECKVIDGIRIYKASNNLTLIEENDNVALKRVKFEDVEHVQMSQHSVAIYTSNQLHIGTISSSTHLSYDPDIGYRVKPSFGRTKKANH